MTRRIFDYDGGGCISVRVEDILASESYRRFLAAVAEIRDAASQGAAAAPEAATDHTAGAGDAEALPPQSHFPSAVPRE